MQLHVRLAVLAPTFAILLAGIATAQNQNFNNYTQEDYRATTGFSAPNWSVTSNTAGETGNSWQTVLYSQDSILNTRITGTVDATNGSNEDDIFGLVLGFNPGDSANTSANYTLLDWKGNTQDNNFAGIGGASTPATTAGGGIALSQVQGAPTADELWGHTNIGSDSGGRVTELSRGNTLGLTDYTTPTSTHNFEIFYEPHRVRVFVDGVLQFNQAGNFSDGRLGLYESHQDPGATFSNFNIEAITPADATTPDAPGPPATVASGSTVTGSMNVDFNTFTQEDYQQTSGFSAPNWQTDGVSAGEIGNSSATVFYGQQDVYNTRITGTIQPTTTFGTNAVNNEDDIFGLVFGFNPGDTQATLNDAAAADYLLLDWKGNTQDFDFTGNAKDDITPGATAAGGLALSRVLGSPTTDELWGHTNFEIEGSGSVTELARGNNLSNSDYLTDGSPHTFDIYYTQSRVQVFVDGYLEIDETGDFPNGRFGLFESHQSQGALFSNFTMEEFDGNFIDPEYNVVGIAIDSDGAGTWTIAGESVGAGAMLTTPPNGGDLELAIQPFGIPNAGDGVMIATISENGANVTAEAPFNHTGWGRGQHGIATANTPAGSEGNADVAIAFFPFEQGWIGGNVLPNGTLEYGQGLDSSNITLLQSPNPSDQDGLYNVEVPGVNSQTDGLLFSVGASNEDNVTAAVPNADGSGWRISVRDNGSSPFSDADGFENDDFGFVYVPKDTQNLTGGRVTGFDTNDEAILSVEAGEFTLTRDGVGEYRLQVDGVLDAAAEGILLLTASEEQLLSDGELAPLNTYLTYEANGSEFLIQNLQLGPGGPTLVDGGFYFAFMDFDAPFAPAANVPEPATLASWLLLGVVGLGLRRLRKRS